MTKTYLQQSTYKHKRIQVKDSIPLTLSDIIFVYITLIEKKKQILLSYNLRKEYVLFQNYLNIYIKCLNLENTIKFAKKIN